MRVNAACRCEPPFFGGVTVSRCHFERQRGMALTPALSQGERGLALTPALSQGERGSGEPLARLRERGEG